MTPGDYAGFQALDPFFCVVMQGLGPFVDGDHYFDAMADDVVFEVRYDFPGWPRVTRGRVNLMDLFAGYGANIHLERGDELVVHAADNGRVLILEYEVHGKAVATGAAYDNRFISVVTIENRKIVRWRDYMDSLAAWNVLNMT